MDAILFKTIGTIGLLLISIGVLTDDAWHRNVMFTFGGVGLLIYSSYLADPIFIILQIVFILASLYEIYKLKKS